MDYWEMLSLDLPPLLAATFSAVACALLGNYLLLRRLSLMGDAISHSVLPGIVAAFLLTSSRTTWPVFVGAALAGIVSAVLIEIVRRYGKMESGAAMGVIFSILFALGVLLIEQAAARSIDLDADCLLHGQLESIFWYPPKELGLLVSWSTLMLLPNEVITSFLTMLCSIGFVAIFYKELKLTTFDPALADALGFSSRLLHTLLMILVAFAVVASFKVVGSILVIAMIICPAAIARLLTDRLAVQLQLSVAAAIFCSICGYVLGALAPLWLGFQNSVSAAGMITVVAGITLAGTVILAPRYGVVSRAVRQWNLALSVRREDILAFLFRAEELGTISKGQGLKESEVRGVFGGNLLTALALFGLKRQSKLNSLEGELSLSDNGRDAAGGIIRSHRLWESYLVRKAGLRSDHVHHTAERLEHVTAPNLQQEASGSGGAPKTDPHGRHIP